MELNQKDRIILEAVHTQVGKEQLLAAIDQLLTIHDGQYCALEVFRQVVEAFQ